MLRSQAKLRVVLLCFFLTITFSTVAYAQNGNYSMDQNMTELLENIPWLGPVMVGFGLMACLLFFLIPLIIGILLCIWIYRDAEKRGKEGLLWVILLIIATVFLNIIGLVFVVIFWILVRPPIQESPPTT